MLTLKIREEVGKNTSKCRNWSTKVDAYWKTVTFQKVKTHTHCTQISWTSCKRRDNWSLNTSLRLLKLVCITYWSAGLYDRLHWYWTGIETKHGLTAAAAESWCHHLPTYCVDRGLVDGAPVGKEYEQQITLNWVCVKVSNMLVASSVQVQGSSCWKCSVDIVL